MSTTKTAKRTNKTKPSEKAMLSFQCDDEQAEALKARAAALGLPYSYLLRNMLGDFLHKSKQAA
jgi:predicted DNA binding CopG/RHH family protein